MSLVELDLTNLSTSGVGPAGVSPEDIDAQRERAAGAVEVTAKLRAHGDVGFFDLPDARATAQACLEYARKLPAEIENFVVLGIGGSSLGARALYGALARPFDAVRQ